MNRLKICKQCEKIGIRKFAIRDSIRDSERVRWFCPACEVRKEERQEKKERKENLELNKIFGQNLPI